ncbi:MAG: GAF domain-containing protein, partial [Armatimonadota bacterium]|nr:GAF domain-containing protein [Armatimonadota bacterium]
VHVGDTIRIGETILGLEPQVASAAAGDFIIPAAVPTAEPAGRVAASVDARSTDGEAFVQTATAEATRRLGLLYDVLFQCATATQLDTLLPTVVERLVEIIPGAARGALLLRDRTNNTLLLKAFHSAQGPVVSETLARRAMREGIGFIWQRHEADDFGQSIAHYRIEAAMYAPLLWQGVPLGVMCVDNPSDAATFAADDLRLLTTVAHYLAMALANEQLQEALRRESALKAILMRQFSPQIAEQLLSQGMVQLSGERSEVTILCSDIRGFTNLTKDMEPIDVVEMLNDYYNRLIPVVFAHHGSVHKYIGDAILTVFGSPKKDPDQHLNALRAGLAMQQEIIDLNMSRAAKGRVTCQIGIGVHCGEVLQGYIGAVDQVDYTVIGEAVNRATRYCDGAPGGEVLISPQIYQWVWKMVEVEPTTIIAKHEGSFPAFRLLSIKDS